MAPFLTWEARTTGNGWARPALCFAASATNIVPGSAFALRPSVNLARRALGKPWTKAAGVVRIEGVSAAALAGSLQMERPEFPGSRLGGRPRPTRRG